jgi:UDP-N-acetyl-D-glucosamine dehydrogenase
MTPHDDLKNLATKISARTAKVGVFGAGYVGLPLACAFAQAGFRTTAIDNDLRKVRAIGEGSSYVEDDFVSRTLPGLVRSRILEASDNPSEAASVVDFAIIAVPTPLNEREEPDLSYVLEATKTISDEIVPGKFVILESSVYPGTTEGLLKPILERGGLQAGRDFGLVHSPERIDYANKGGGILDIPKVVGGITPLCTQIACDLYSKVLRAQPIPVSNTTTAEATKMLENTYRFVNIALVNELAILHEKLGIDFFEVVKAASTKPFGFQAFYPGPGVGGHCIPKDPRYLLFRASQADVDLRMVRLSIEINDGMIDYIIQRLGNHLRNESRLLHGSKVVILGLAFKADVSDSRQSPSIRLAEKLVSRGAKVSAYDPYVRQLRTKVGQLGSGESLEECVSKADIIVLATPHSVFKSIDLNALAPLMNRDPVIFDARGFWSEEACKSAGFKYLGLGRPQT